MIVQDLSANLRGVLEFEVAHGNSIVRVDRPAGSQCPLAVIFAQPLGMVEFNACNNNMASGVETWENRDTHYPLEAGYICKRTRHTVAGPIK